MDAYALHALSEVVGPVVGCIGFFGTIVGVYALRVNFKLRSRELELEAQIGAREAEARLRALETRMHGLESALGAVVAALPLSAPPRSEPPAELPAAPEPARLAAVAAQLGPRERK